MISLWTWNDSNGSATKAETMAAYSAITNNGQVSEFSYKVWNDLVAKINEIILSIKPEWISTYGSYVNTQMSEQDKELTANRFNAAVTNTYYMWWSWANDPSATGYVGRKDFRGYARYGNNSDLVYGSYFVELADRMNTMIHVINDDEYAKDAVASLVDQVSCLVECEAIKVVSFTVNEIQTCGSVPVLSPLRPLSQETAEILRLYFSAELELFDNRNGISAFIVDTIMTVARARALQSSAIETECISTVTGSTNASTDETTSLDFNTPMGIIGEYLMNAISSGVLATNNVDRIINDTDASNLHSDAINTVTISVENGEKTLGQNRSLPFGNNVCADAVSHEAMMSVINIYQAFMQASVSMVIGNVAHLVKLIGEAFETEEELFSLSEADFEALIDPESINVNSVNLSTSVAVFELMGIIGAVTNAVQTVVGNPNFALGNPLGFEGSALGECHAGGSMELQYTKLVYATAIMAMVLSMQQTMDEVSSERLEINTALNLAIADSMEYLMSACMEELNHINLSLSASANSFHSRHASTSIPINVSIFNSMDAEMLKRFRTAIFINVLLSAGFDMQRSYGTEAVSNNALTCTSALEIADMFVRAFCEVASSVSSSSDLECMNTANSMSAGILSAIVANLTGVKMPSVSLGNVNNSINLLITPNIESKILAPMHVELAMVMTCGANFDFEASWDYPDLIGTVLYVRQVKKMEQINKTLYLDANDNISVMSMHMDASANIDGWHTIEGTCRIISFHVGESGTLSLTTSSEWIYPIHKGNAELSVRQVKSATKTGETLEVS